MSTDEVVKFITGTDQNITVSPSTISLEVYDTKEGNKEKVDLEPDDDSTLDWSFTLEFIYGAGFSEKLNLGSSLFTKEYKAVDDSQESILEEDPNYFHKRIVSLQSVLNEASDDDNIIRLKELLKSQEIGVFKFTIVPPSSLSKAPIIQLVNFRYGISSELATFSIHAAGFNSAVDKTGLNFSEEGLTITNGGFKIVKTTGDSSENIFDIDENGINLKGNIYANGGYFRGDITGASGIFSGSIIANSGIIGGFQIGQDSLISLGYFVTKDTVKDDSKTYYYYDSTEGQYVEFEGTNFFETVIYYERSETPNGVRLYADGHIEADNISLGTGATVNEYIKLGNAYLRNPDSNSNRILLEAGEVSLTDQGELKIGAITASGTNGSLSASSENGIYGWSIKGDGTAVFNDIYADTVRLANTILEIGTVQSVGSLMLFKDSWTVTKVEGKTIQIIGIPNLQEKDWLYTGENVYQIDSIDFSESLEGITTITLKQEPEDIMEKTVITKFGQANQDYVFSILGENPRENDQNLWDFANGNSLTIASFSEVESPANNNANNALTYKPRLVLGTLDGIKSYSKGTGLYADNVFLNGSLTTIVGSEQSPTYAGVNTLDGAIANSNFHNNDNSKIVFWAGSSAMDNASIAAAPFQVTEQGSLYASQGHFSKSIISDSTITASEIRAARVIGDGINNALRIYDANGGIGFYQSVNEIDTTDTGDDKEVFRITPGGMGRESQGEIISFIKIDNQVEFYGDVFSGGILKSENKETDEILSLELSNGLQYKKNDYSYGQLIFSDKNTQLIFSEDKVIEAKDGEVLIEELIKIDKKGREIVFLDGEIERMLYRQVTGKGYDLYIN